MNQTLQESGVDIRIMRILHVVNNLNVNSGVMSVLMNYYRHVDRSVVQFDFIYFFEVEGADYKQEIGKLGGRYYYIGKPGLSFSYQKKIKKFFQEHAGEFIAVHCHPIWSSEVFAIESKRAGIRHIIQHSHSTRLGNNPVSAIRNWFLVKVLGLFATEYAACSEEATVLLGRKKNVHIFRNAIECKKYSYDTKARDTIRREFDIPDNRLVLGHVGRFAAEKNHEFLIDIHECLVSQGVTSDLMLVGDGLLKDKMEQIVSARRLPRVHFVGKRTDVPQLLSAFDVFVFPSKYEGVPLAVIEALATGLPCVISASITKSLQTSNTSFLELSLGPMGWAKKIAAIGCSANKRKSDYEIGSRGYDIEIEAKRLESYYRSLQ